MKRVKFSGEKRSRSSSTYSGWWFQPSEKYSSVGVTIPNIWKNKNVPNHQPDINNIHIMVRLIF